MRRPRGTGRIYRQKGSTIWWIKFYRNGEPFRESTGTCDSALSNCMLVRLETYASARFTLLMASSISCVLLKPIVALSTPAFWKANLIAFTRSS